MDDLPTFSPDFANAADASQVLCALAKVDQVYHAAVALFYLEDCSYDEIAKTLEISPWHCQITYSARNSAAS